MTDVDTVYSFCEPVWATSNRWCIRARPATMPLKPGGGIQTGSLCGRVPAGNGWDVDVDFPKLFSRLQNDAKALCQRCAKIREESP